MSMREPPSRHPVHHLADLLPDYCVEWDTQGRVEIYTRRGVLLGHYFAGIEVLRLHVAADARTEAGRARLRSMLRRIAAIGIEVQVSESPAGMLLFHITGRNLPISLIALTVVLAANLPTFQRLRPSR